jgi:hypothetical protein
VSHKLIRAAYESRLKTWADARTPALSIAWENLPFTEPAGLYLRAYLLPADTDAPDLAGATRVYVGVFQVNVVAPLNKGAGEAMGVADELAALFVVDTQLTNTITVQQTTPCRIAPALASDTRYVLPVSFQYRADA